MQLPVYEAGKGGFGTVKIEIDYATGKFNAVKRFE
jgi:hypothetical protein